MSTVLTPGSFLPAHEARGARVFRFSYRVASVSLVEVVAAAGRGRANGVKLLEAANGKGHAATHAQSYAFIK